MSKRENFSESSFYPVEHQSQGEWVRPAGQEQSTANYHHHHHHPPQDHNEERNVSVDHNAGKYSFQLAVSH